MREWHVELDDAPGLLGELGVQLVQLLLQVLLAGALLVRKPQVNESTFRPMSQGESTRICQPKPGSESILETLSFATDKLLDTLLSGFAACVFV